MDCSAFMHSSWPYHLILNFMNIVLLCDKQLYKSRCSRLLHFLQLLLLSLSLISRYSYHTIRRRSTVQLDALWLNYSWQCFTILWDTKLHYTLKWYKNVWITNFTTEIHCVFTRMDYVYVNSNVMIILSYYWFLCNLWNEVTTAPK